MNSGNITIEGGGTSFTNTYTHGSINHIQATVNNGTINFIPYTDDNNTFYEKYTAGFIVSPDGGRSLNVMYNSGDINTWTTNAVMFGYSGGSKGKNDDHRGNQA